MPKVFAGGDVVRGGSTVIQAMPDGRAAAEAIDRALSEREDEPAPESPQAAMVTRRHVCRIGLE